MGDLKIEERLVLKCEIGPNPDYPRNMDLYNIDNLITSLSEKGIKIDPRNSLKEIVYRPKFNLGEVEIKVPLRTKFDKEDEITVKSYELRDIGDGGYYPLLKISLTDFGESNCGIKCLLSVEGDLISKGRLMETYDTARKVLVDCKQK